MNKRPVILTFAPFYQPGYKAGGPIRTISNLADRLGGEFEFKIVTSDRDFGDHCPYSCVKANSWVERGKASVKYVNTRGFGMGAIKDIVQSTPHDLIYLNSFFDPLFTQKILMNRKFGRLRDRPIVLATRGEFSESALRLKAAKKNIYIRLVKWLRLYDGLTWQASSGREAEDIGEVMSVGQRTPGKISVAPNLVKPLDFSGLSDKSFGRRQSSEYLSVCFLSRVSPMKNLDCALRILAKVKNEVKFDIYGPMEDPSYWLACQKQIDKMPQNINVSYLGAVESNVIHRTLQQYDLFFLPTRGENFGHVIQEALQAGLPILISDQTPWRNLEDKGVGWDLPLDEEKEFVRRIEEVAEWSPESDHTWRSRACAYAANVANNSSVVEANRQLFLEAII